MHSQQQLILLKILWYGAAMRMQFVVHCCQLQNVNSRKVYSTALERGFANLKSNLFVYISTQYESVENHNIYLTAKRKLIGRFK